MGPVGYIAPGGTLQDTHGKIVQAYHAYSLPQQSVLDVQLIPAWRRVERSYHHSHQFGVAGCVGHLLVIPNDKDPWCIVCFVVPNETKFLFLPSRLWLVLQILKEYR
nr:hypothetical protein [Bacillus toyonensis]